MATTSPSRQYAAIADRAVETACKQLKVGVDFRQPRFDDIKKNEDMNAGKVKPALAGRFNIPIDGVIMEGFVETLMSEIDNAPRVIFERTQEKDLKAAQKMTSLLQDQSSATKENWPQKDLDGKKLAILSGRAILKSYTERNPYKSVLEVVDHYDFVTEPKGGSNLDKHLFKGQMNIFRTVTDLKLGVDSGRYDSVQVLKLKGNTANKDFKRNEDLYRNKVARLESFGFNPDSHEYVGVQLYNLTEWCMFFEGAWWYMVFDYPTGTWLRFEPLEKVFSIAEKIPGRAAWLSWATHIEPFNFWSKAPADGIRPVAEAMKLILNQTFDNVEKRNWDMTAYDSKMFPDPSKLMWRRGGLAKAVIKDGKSIAQGIYKFQTPDTTTITINLMSFLDNFTGTKLGVTSGLQGQEKSDKVGIAFANLQQSKGRLGLTNKQYGQFWHDAGLNFDYGTWDHLTESEAVQIIGINGLEWDIIKHDDTMPDFRIRVEGGNAADEANMIKTEKQERAIARLQADRRFAPFLNPKWEIEVIMRNGGFDEEEIRVAMDVQNFATQEILAEAAEAIDDIIKGKKPKMYRNATLAFQEKIEAFAYDNTNDNYPLFKKLIAYSAFHDETVKQNTMRQAQMVARMQQTAMMAAGTNASPSSAPTLKPETVAAPSSTMTR